MLFLLYGSECCRHILCTVFISSLQLFSIFYWPPEQAWTTIITNDVTEQSTHSGTSTVTTSRMGQQISKAGSTKRKKIFQSWKTSVWELHIDATNINNELIKLQKENEQKLASQCLQTLQLEKELTIARKEITRKTSENQELQSLLTTAENNFEELQVSHRQLQTSSYQQGRSNINKRSSSNSVDQSKPKRKRTDFSVLSRQQQWSRKKELCKDVNNALSFMEKDGIKASAVEFVHTETNQTEILDVQTGKYRTEGTEASKSTSETEFILYVKEKFGLSDSAYHELSMICSELPRACQLKALAKKMNSSSEIKPCPGGFGVQQSLKSRLIVRIMVLLKENKIKSGETVQVKLTGDGTKICRKLNLINFCFTLLNEGDIAKSPRGNHTIAIINSTEKYEDLKIALSDIRSEVQSLTSIKCDGMDFPIEYFLCSDLKFLAVICGIDSATSTYPCIWCKCPASKRHDMDAEWSFKGNGARTISDIQACCKHSKAKRFNCTNMPLFPTVPIDHTVVDMLHLFLRVTDVLFNLLVLDIRRMDAIVKCTSESNLDSSDNLHKLERFLHGSVQ